MGGEDPKKMKLAEEEKMAASLSDTTSPAPPPTHAATPTSAAPPPFSEVMDPHGSPISAATSPVSAPPPPHPLPQAAASAESEAAADDEYKPYELFPEIELASLPDVSEEERRLLMKQLEFENFWKNSCYYLQPEASHSSNKDAEIERYSDRFKKSAKAKREEFESWLKLTPRNFPSELFQDVQHDNKKLQLDQESVDQMHKRALERLEHYAKIEEESKGKKEKVKRKKSEDVKNGSDEEESENDYTQTKPPSDDEDDFNMLLD